MGLAQHLRGHHLIACSIPSCKTLLYFVFIVVEFSPRFELILRLKGNYLWPGEHCLIPLKDLTADTSRDSDLEQASLIALGPCCSFDISFAAHLPSMILRTKLWRIGTESLWGQVIKSR